MLKRFWKVKTLVVAMIMTAAAALPATAAENALPLVKLTYWRSIDDLPLYVGIEKGFFEEAGIKVEPVFIKGEQNALAGALKGDVDGGYMSLASIFKLSEKNLPVKVVAWMGHGHKGTRCGIHVASQSDIHQLADLRGKRIASSGSIMVKTLLAHAAAKGGMTLKDLRPLWGGTPDNPMQHEAALRSGGIDGFIV